VAVPEAASLPAAAPEALTPAPAAPVSTPQAASLPAAAPFAPAKDGSSGYDRDALLEESMQELKAECAKRGLSQSGFRKQHLVERLMAAAGVPAPVAAGGVPKVAVAPKVAAASEVVVADQVAQLEKECARLEEECARSASRKDHSVVEPATVDRGRGVPKAPPPFVAPPATVGGKALPKAPPPFVAPPTEMAGGRLLPKAPPPSAPTPEAAAAPEAAPQVAVAPEAAAVSKLVKRRRKLSHIRGTDGQPDQSGLDTSGSVPAIQAAISPEVAAAARVVLAIHAAIAPEVASAAGVPLAAEVVAVSAATVAPAAVKEVPSVSVAVAASGSKAAPECVVAPEAAAASKGAASNLSRSRSRSPQTAKASSEVAAGAVVASEADVAALPEAVTASGCVTAPECVAAPEAAAAVKSGATIRSRSRSRSRQADNGAEASASGWSFADPIAHANGAEASASDAGAAVESHIPGARAGPLSRSRSPPSRPANLDALSPSGGSGKASGGSREEMLRQLQEELLNETPRPSLATAEIPLDTAPAAATAASPPAEAAAAAQGVLQSHPTAAEVDKQRDCFLEKEARRRRSRSRSPLGAGVSSSDNIVTPGEAVRQRSRSRSPLGAGISSSDNIVTSGDAVRQPVHSVDEAPPVAGMQGVVLGRRKADPATVVEKLRPVAAGDAACLAVLTGIVCARLASPQSFSREDIHSELAPLVRDDSKVEDLLDWLCQEQDSQPSASSSASATATELCCGAKVRLQGLRAAPHLNGQLGICEEWDSSSARWKVRLAVGGEIKSVKRDNLIADAVSTASAAEEATSAASGAEPRKTGSAQMQSALQKLKAKADAEARGEKVSKPEKETFKRYGIGDPRGEAQRRTQAAGGAGRYHPSDCVEISKEPIAFVSSEDATVQPIRKVVVVDPRRQGMQDDDGRDSSPEPEIGRIVPPVPVPGRPQRRSSWCSWKESSPIATASSSWTPAAHPGYAVQPPSWGVPQAPALAHPPQYDAAGPRESWPAPGPPPAMPPMAPQQPPSLSSPFDAAPTVFENRPPASPVRRPQTATAEPPASPVGGNLTLTVSDAAREEDRTVKSAKDKVKALQESKKKMLFNLTKQLQHCITRVQSGELDEDSREKYEDMIMKLKAQVEKIT